jgi:hypothetical protein
MQVKTLLAGVIVIASAGSVFAPAADAQYIDVNAYHRPYTPYGAVGAYGYGGYGYGAYGAGTTAGGSMATGMGNYIRSQGAYNQMTAAAMKDVQKAKSMELDNKLKASQTYEQMREVNQRYVDEKKAREKAAYASNVPPPKRPRLTPSQLDPVTGEIRWPQVLMAPQFAPYREKLQTLFTMRASDPSRVTYTDVSAATGPMRDEYDKLIGTMATNDFFAGRHFIEAVAEESRFTGFEDHMAAGTK